MTAAARWLVVLAVVAGCKEAGTAAVTVTHPDDCTINDETLVVTHFVAFLLPDGRCSDCSCDGCGAGPCDAGACHQAACASGSPPPCPVADLDDGLTIGSAEPGPYAIVLQFYAEDGRQSGPVALACDELLLERDGTADLSLMPAAGCCGPERPDADVTAAPRSGAGIR